MEVYDKQEFKSKTINFAMYSELQVTYSTFCIALLQRKSRKDIYCKITAKETWQKWHNKIEKQEINLKKYTINAVFPSSVTQKDHLRRTSDPE